MTGPCTEGYYCPGGSEKGDDVECPVGNYCEEGAEIPTPCPAGTYNPSISEIPLCFANL